MGEVLETAAAESAAAPSRPVPKAPWVRAQDLVWVLLFSALAAVSPNRSLEELEMLGGLALLQLAAPRITALNGARGDLIVNGLKLVLGFLLIGVTGGILSNYHLILILPVISAATTLGAVGTTVFTILSCLVYLSFIPIATMFGFRFDVDLLRDLSLRTLFLPVIGYFTYQLASDNRNQTRRAKQAAEELVEANRKLQEAEASVRRSERLAALGQLTAGLAHELRNPLGTIRASSEMLKQRLAPTNELALELFGYITSEVERANSLITRFLDFARPMKLKKVETDLNLLVERAVDKVVREKPHAASSVHKNFAPDTPPIEADPDLLESVFFNLVRNAIEASPDGGSVTVKTRATSRGAEVAVIDRGSGIAPEHREQIFNPFFTTKSDGVGLGLAISAKIVDEHQGTITVESEPNKGSIFVVDLPRKSVAA